MQTRKVVGSPASGVDYSFTVELMQYLVVPTFVLDEQGKVLIWNKACERLTGLSADKLIGTQNHWMAFYESARPCLADIFIQHREKEMARLYLAHQSDGQDSHGIHAENWCHMPHLGESRYLAIDAGPIYDRQGRLVAVIETLRDMTPLKQAQDQLEALATQDGLTQIGNRRSFDERLEREWKRAIREKNSLAVLMMDVDFFKRYNDTYGHQAGDACLKKIAETLKATLKRPGDFIARYGGEEFAAILPDVSLPGAKLVAEQMVDAIRSLHIPHFSSSVGPFVTLSLGISHTSMPRHIGPTELVKAADEALYKSKEAGRDQSHYAKATRATKAD